MNAPKDERFLNFADAEYSTDQQWTSVLSQGPLRVDAVEKGLAIMGPVILFHLIRSTAEASHDWSASGRPSSAFLSV
jgi:hypothetical protein